MRFEPWLHARVGSLCWAITRLGEPAAIGPIVWLLYLPFGLIGPLLIDRQRLGGGLVEWLLIGLLSQLVLMLWFWLAGLVIHRGGPAGHSRPWLTLLAIVGAGFLRGLVLAFAVYAVGLTSEPEIAYRLRSAVLAQSVLLVLLALTASALAYHRRLAAQLEQQRQSIADLNDSMRETLERVNAELVAEVHRTIDPLITSLDRRLERIEAGSETEPVLESIRQLVDDDLRPLSTRLANAPEEAVAPGSAPGGMGPGKVPLPSALRLERLLRPGAAAVLLFPLALSQALRSAALPQALIFPVVTALLALAVLALVRRLVGRWSPPLWAGIGVVSLIVAGSTSLILGIQRSIGLPVPQYVGYAGFFAGAIIGALTAWFVAVNEQRTATEQGLRASVDELQAIGSVLRQNAFVARRRLSTIVHGSLQSALNAAAMRLATPAPGPETVRQVRRDIAAAVARIDDNGSSYVLLVDTLADITELWDGTCTVRWTVDHQTIRLLAQSPACAASAAEISRECVNNAIRHGGASEVWITIARSGECIMVTAVDNGSGVHGAAVDGLGSRMLDEVCVEWTRESGSGGTTVVAQLASPRQI